MCKGISKKTVLFPTALPLIPSESWPYILSWSSLSLQFCNGATSTVWWQCYEGWFRYQSPLKTCMNCIKLMNSWKMGAGIKSKTLMTFSKQLGWWGTHSHASSQLGDKAITALLLHFLHSLIIFSGSVQTKPSSFRSAVIVCLPGSLWTFSVLLTLRGPLEGNLRNGVVFHADHKLSHTCMCYCLQISDIGLVRRLKTDATASLKTQ